MILIFFKLTLCPLLSIGPALAMYVHIRRDGQYVRARGGGVWGWGSNPLLHA